MAGDWIKMRIDLQNHPKVVRILSLTNSDKFRVVGGLHAVWSIFDTHSNDGRLVGYTPDTMDHVIGWKGLCSALIKVGWLHFDGHQTLTMPEFVEHNGKGGKRRAEDQKRKRNFRKASATCPQLVHDATEKQGKENGLEKRREEYIKTPLTPQGEAFEKFYSAYPKKRNKGQAEKAFKKIKPSPELLEKILKAIEQAKTSHGWLKEGGEFIPYPSTWLNAKGWEDEFSDGPPSGTDDYSQGAV